MSEEWRNEEPCWPCWQGYCDCQCSTCVKAREERTRTRIAELESQLAEYEATYGAMKEFVKILEPL